jgi:hypothetical protein
MLCVMCYVLCVGCRVLRVVTCVFCFVVENINQSADLLGTSLGLSATGMETETVGAAILG